MRTTTFESYAATRESGAGGSWQMQTWTTTSLSSANPGTQNSEGPTDEIPGWPFPQNSGSVGVPLAIGGSFDGVVNTAGDLDAFFVNLVAGQSYVFTLTGSGATPLEDPFLALYGIETFTSAIDDDGGPGRNSQLRFTAQVTGTYVINAMAWDAYDLTTPPALTGGYTITAALGPPQNPLDTIDLGFALPDTNISVYFATAGQTFNGVTASVSWSTVEIAAAMQAMATFSAIAPLTFTQVSTPDDATFILSLAELEPGILGQFSSSAIGTVGTGGFGVFDPTNEFWSAAQIRPGGQGFITLMHEIGHGLGLAHPHDNGGIDPDRSSEIMEGVLEDFDSFGTFGMNTAYATIMSYNRTNEFSPGTLDIALLQEKYGVNTTTNSGDDTYQMPLEGELQVMRAIWDTGGNDTVAYAGASFATIDLNPASLLSEHGGAGNPSRTTSSKAGFVIAHGVVIENASGGTNNDELIGNVAANTLSGNGGNDRLIGYAGADTLDGGAGDDMAMYDLDPAGIVVNLLTQTVVDGWGFIDTLSSIEQIWGTAFDDTFTTGPEAVFIRAAAGNDTVIINSLAGGVADGGAGDDMLTGGAGADSLSGDLGNDVISGGDGDDFISGHNGNNLLDGGAGADRMEGGDNNDTYTVDNIDDLVVEFNTGGQDRVRAWISYVLGERIEELALLGSANLNGTGNALANIILGNSGANVLNGGEGNDALYGGAGKDTIDGGLGADFMRGGAGDDLFIVDNAGDVVSEDVNAGFDRVEASVSYALSANLEHLTLTGAGAINGTGNAQANTILGNAGANILIGGDGNDALYGGAQGDRIDGSGGADFMRGGLGDDTFVVDDNVGDVVQEDAGGGIDRVEAFVDYRLPDNVEQLALLGTGAVVGLGNNLINLILGNAGDNRLYGYVGNDSIYGGAGHDFIDGGEGVDFMRGGFGDDTFILDETSDVVSEDVGQGNDQILAFSPISVTYTLPVNVEILRLQGISFMNGTGNAQDNIITGNAGANTLLGLGGSDALYGGGGSDRLDGGAGNDFLQGGGIGDIDIFMFTTSLATTGIDTISDFDAAFDQIWLDDAVFTGIAAGALNANAFTTGTAATDALDRIIYDPTTGALYYDADGSGAGASVQIATLSTNLALTSANIFGI